MRLDAEVNMKKISSHNRSFFLLLFIALSSVACEQVENITSGIGGGDKVSAGTVEGGGSDGSSGQTAQLAQADAAPSEPKKLRLDAFRDFDCGGNWTNRDGGLGLKAGSGSGTCRARFSGTSGEYRITLMAQTEFDGAPKFSISIDGNKIAAGRYPMSKGKLICDCPNWRVNCPDRIVPIDAGVHAVNNGSTIEFFGQEVYPCGSGSHGAYAKWRELVFTPN